MILYTQQADIQRAMLLCVTESSNWITRMRRNSPSGIFFRVVFLVGCAETTGEQEFWRTDPIWPRGVPRENAVIFNPVTD